MLSSGRHLHTALLQMTLVTNLPNSHETPHVVLMGRPTMSGVKGAFVRSNYARITPYIPKPDAELG